MSVPVCTPTKGSKRWVPTWAVTVGAPEFLERVGAVTGEVWARVTDALRKFGLSGGVWRVSDPDLRVSLLFSSFYRHQFVENNLILKMGPVDKRKVSLIPAAPPRVSVSSQPRQGLAPHRRLRLTLAACASLVLVPFLERSFLDWAAQEDLSHSGEAV